MLQINNEYFNLIDVITEAFDTVVYSAADKNISLLLQFDVNKPFIYW